MGFLNLTNNQLLPANQRAADVAANAVEGIMPVLQQRTNAAFRVQGMTAIIYKRLFTGIKCSCQSHGPQLNSRLDKEGNADSALINQLITGNPKFGTEQYAGVDLHPMHYSGPEPTSEQLPGLWSDYSEPEINPETANDPDGGVYDNGLRNDPDLILHMQQEYGGFDPSSLSFGEFSCPVCFGTGYVGGYSVYNGYRHVIQASDLDLPLDAELLIKEKPFKAETTYFKAPLLIPRGFFGLDVLRVACGLDTVPCQLFIDGVPASVNVLKQKADGRIHLLEGKFNKRTKITHVEFQLNLSEKSSFIEFPRLSKASRIDVINRIDDFTVLASPDIPLLEMRDVICESRYGNALLVQTTSDHSTRAGHRLDWEINVRVVQPQEVFNSLPRRKPVFQMERPHQPSVGNIGKRF